LYYSLTSLSFRTLRNPTLIGFGNYLETLSDPKFWEALGFSLQFGLICAGLEVLLGLLMAVLFQPLLERHKPLLALLLLPMMISPALLGIMYRLILNDFVGVVPRYLQLLGVPAMDLFGPQTALLTLVIIELLQWTPFAFLILYTALQALPQELLEAATVDGASAWQSFRFVTFPLLIPALVIAGFIRFIDSFRVFDHIFVLTGGGPGTATTSIAIYIYKHFFQADALGPAIAASILLLLLSLIPLIISMRLAVRGAGRD
jgi:multiple sugar transport system permease protein